MIPPLYKLDSLYYVDLKNAIQFHTIRISVENRHFFLVFISRIVYNVFESLSFKYVYKGGFILWHTLFQVNV